MVCADAVAIEKRNIAKNINIAGDFLITFHEVSKIFKSIGMVFGFLTGQQKSEIFWPCSTSSQDTGHGGVRYLNTKKTIYTVLIMKIIG